MKKIIRSNRSLSAFVIISLITLLAGIATAPGNELLYSILGQYIVLPVACLICSACAAKKGKFFHPVIFTVISTLLPLLVFGVTDIVFLIFSGVPSAAGLIIGALAYAFTKSKKAEEKISDEQSEEDVSDEDDISVGAEDANSSQANAPEEEDVEEA